MDFRSAALVIALSSLGVTGVAQESAPKEVPTPAAQDPDRPTKTPAQRIEELKTDQARLAKEIEYVRERVAKSRDLIREKLGRRGLELRSIDAGTNSVTPVLSSPDRRPAALLTNDQVTALGDDVLLLVEGRPVRQADLDQLTGYMEAAGTAPTDDVRNQRAMLELLRIESAIGSFPDAAAEAAQQMSDAMAELNEGKDFVEVAKKYTRGPLVQDAKLTFTRNCPFGLFVEKAVFETPEGKTTEIVRGQTGYALVKVEKLNKGESPIQDSVEGRLILIPYHPDPNELQQVSSRVALGNVSMQLRDKSVIDLLPVMMRPSQIQAEQDVTPKLDAVPDKGSNKAEIIKKQQAEKAANGGK